MEKLLRTIVFINNEHDGAVLLGEVYGKGRSICRIVYLEGDCLNEQEKDVFRKKTMDMGDVDATLGRMY